MRKCGELRDFTYTSTQFWGLNLEDKNKLTLGVNLKNVNFEERSKRRPKILILIEGFYYLSIFYLLRETHISFICKKRN